MENIFSSFQKNALKNIWILGCIIVLFNLSTYFIFNYGPDNKLFNTIIDFQIWVVNSLIFSWYFLKNKFFKQAFIIAILFIPYYIFEENVSLSIDYFLPNKNIEFIYKIIPFITYIIPLFFFAFFYYRIENQNIKRVKFFIFQFLLVLILNYTLDSDPDNLYSFVNSFSNDTPWKQDILVFLIFILFALKSICLLIAYLYISNRIGSIKKTVNPLEIQNINTAFFTKGFIISFTILFFIGIDLLKSIAYFTFTEISISSVFSLFSFNFVLLISGRFFGQLIQYRNYSLKKYFGVINIFSTLPILNISTLLVLRLSKINSDVEKYISTLNKKRLIHIGIYMMLLTLYFTYQYFNKDKEVRTFNDFYYLPLYLIAVFLVSQFKWSAKVVPFIVVGCLYYKDLISYFTLTEGLRIFFKTKIISLAWISGLSMCLLYYVLYYILHKSFYTRYFKEKNDLKMKEELSKFEK